MLSSKRILRSQSRTETGTDNNQVEDTPVPLPNQMTQRPGQRRQRRGRRGGRRSQITDIQPAHVADFPEATIASSSLPEASGEPS